MRLIIFSLLTMTVPSAAFSGNSLPADPDVSADHFCESTSGGLFDFMFLQYREVFSGILAAKCVFNPSCSHYGEQAIHSHGPVRGIMMALERWTRCTSAAYTCGDYEVSNGHGLSDPVNPGEEAICWGRFLLPF